MVAKNTSAEPPADRVLVITRVFDAPRRLVFNAWTKPEFLAQWWGPNNFTLPFCEMDFRIGGAYKLCMRSPEGQDFWVQGVYTEIAPPERLAFTWFRGDGDISNYHRTVVTLTFADVNGKTKLTLHQALFDTTANRDDHNGGWSECLDRLGAFVIEG